jgi:hypothetical protein
VPSAVVTVYVVAPAVQARVATCRVGLWHLPPTVRYPVRVFVSDGINDECPKRPGLVVHWVVTRQKGVPPGRLAVVQLIEVLVTHNGRVCSRADPPKLDNRLFYPVVGQAGLVALRRTARLTTVDSPSYGLTGGGTYSGRFALSTYLLYRPRGRRSIWIALALVRWGFASRAHHRSAAGWVLDDRGTHSWHPVVVSNPRPPSWSAVYKNASPTDVRC